MPEYLARMILHAKLDRGGYLYAYEILADGKVIGGINTIRETRNSPTKTTHTLAGEDGGEDQDFATAAELKAAYEARL